MKHPSDATPPRDTLVGSVERVTFHNEDSGFAVLKVKARGQRDLVPVVGHAATISAGEFIHAVGVWITDRTHGLQFKADFLKTTPPTTAEGIEKYLGSGMVRGIGPKLAERIVAVFGAATFEIIEASPEKLRDVSGIGELSENRYFYPCRFISPLIYIIFYSRNHTRACLSFSGRRLPCIQSQRSQPLSRKTPFWARARTLKLKRVTFLRLTMDCLGGSREDRTCLAAVHRHPGGAIGLTPTGVHFDAQLPR